MSIQFIPIQVEGLGNIDVEYESTWDQYGDPLIKLSGSYIPQEITIQSLLEPTYLNLTQTDVESIFNSTNPAAEDLVAKSGCFYKDFTPTYDEAPFKQEIVARKYINDSGVRDPLRRQGENEKYNYWYGIRYNGVNPTFSTVYDLVVANPLNNIVSMPVQPDNDYFYILSSGIIVDASTTRLGLDINHAKTDKPISSPLQNTGVGQTAYELYIEDGYRNKAYDINGNEFPIGTTPAANRYTTDNITLNLPYSVTNSAGDVEAQDYYIRLRYRGQNGDYTKYMSFSTREIRKFNEAVLDGLDLSTDKTKYKWYIHNDNYLVTKEVSDKRRLSLDINDITLISSKYHKAGRYESNFYTLDNPIYTMFLTTKDSFPRNIGMDSIKYYVQFGELDPIRISPSNRDTEKGIDDEGNEYIIPKIMVLDELELDNTTPEVYQVTLQDSIVKSIYSFKIIIEFDVSAYVEDNFFIPPTIDSYECHVTDRKSFLKV